MFVNIEIDTIIDKNNNIQPIITIIDSDFTDKRFSNGYLMPDVIDTIIDIYSHKKLPVGKNLFQFFLFCQKKFNIAIEKQQGYSYLCETRKEYASEVNKYLLFS